MISHLLHAILSPSPFGDQGDYRVAPRILFRAPCQEPMEILSTMTSYTTSGGTHGGCSSKKERPVV